MIAQTIEAVFSSFMIAYRSMKHCPKCKSQYPDEMVYCLIDGDPLLVNDPEAETLKGEVIPFVRPSLELIKGHAVNQQIKVTINQPYSFLLEHFTMIIFLKRTHKLFGTSRARVGFHGTVALSRGRLVPQPEDNEFLLPLWEKGNNEIDKSVFYWSFSNRTMEFFKATLIGLERYTAELDLTYSFSFKEI